MCEHRFIKYRITKIKTSLVDRIGKNTILYFENVFRKQFLCINFLFSRNTVLSICHIFP